MIAKYIRLALLASAGFFIASAQAQNAGTVTNHAFAIGKGAGQSGYGSLLCANAQMVVGQTAADPICRTASGDATIDAAGAFTLANSASTRTHLGLAIGSNVQAWDADLDAFALKTAPAGAVVGTTDAQTITNKGFNCANNTCIVRLGSDVTGTLPTVNGGIGATNLTALTHKTTPISADKILIADSAASDAYKYATLSEAIAAVSSGVVSLNGQAGALALMTTPSGRLTLTSGVAVTEADVSGASTIYLTPTDTDFTQVYDGTNFVFRTFAERPLILDATGHIANTLYDVWEYWDGATLQVGTGPAYTNSGAGTSTRGTGAGTTEVEIYRGKSVNKNAIVLRNNSVNSSSVPARQANLRGTFRTTSAGLTEDSALKRLLSNLYNAVPRSMHLIEATSGWAYSIATFRQANGSTANQFSIVHCTSGREVYAQVVAHVGNSSGTAGAGTGIGLNTSTADSSVTRQFIFAGAFATYAPQNATYTGYLGAGYQEVRWLERGDGSGNTQTWVGNASSVFIQSGMTGRVIN